MNIPGNTCTPLLPSTGVLHIMNYTSTAFYKVIFGEGTWNSVNSGAGQVNLDKNCCVWQSFQPITSLAMGSVDFMPGSVFTLYGIGQNY
jgi:hypothetical protein